MSSGHGWRAWIISTLTALVIWLITALRRFSFSIDSSAFMISLKIWKLSGASSVVVAILGPARFPFDDFRCRDLSFYESEAEGCFHFFLLIESVI